MTPRLLLSRLSILFVFAVPVQIQAQLPVDPTVVHGAATIDTAGHHMTVTNSPNTILNWQSFSVGPSDSIYFNQQDVNSQVLNRVTGGDPSEIFGHLGSNGGVWLINPYGVLFGPDSRIDAASLVASTLDISNIDFLASRNHFNAVNHFGEVRNQGEIRTTFGGRVWLMGDSVTNENLVQASGGQVVLAAGESVEFVDSGAPHVVVRVRAPENETVNLGALVASNGNIDLHGSIVNQEGFVRANSIGTNGSGQIVLKASETVTLAENSTTQAKHGEVLIESDTVYNHGDISGHEIALTADAIVQQGLISAPGGEVVMQAENSTYLNGQVDVSEKHGAGGNIQITTGKLEGMAGGALHADGEQGGSIRIAGKNSVAFSSTLEATGDQQGGKIEVTGDSVVLLNADVNASGGVQG
ncbi:MAG: filamentous hemagglutinin N-terminal domain-containing protein, partial [Burkholderiales bacterium]|nr:filamentous hemagglutinin N-terminal domain-containing protein [Burkholderiales bacterium]